LFRATLVLLFALGLAEATSAEAAPRAVCTALPPAVGTRVAQVGGSGSGSGSGAARLPSEPFKDDPATSSEEEGASPGRVPGEGEPSAGAEGASAEQDQREEADADADRQDADRPETEVRALTCLEGDAEGGGRRKGVQRRDFLKRRRFELSGVGGFYASDALSSTYSYGGALSFFPSEDFGMELMVTRSPVAFRLEEPFNTFDQERHFPPGVAWQGMLGLLWSPIHAKFKFTEESIIHGDIFVVAGAGRTFHDSVQGLTWEAGFGLKLYLAKYVAFRLDVRDFLLPQEVLGRGRITNNVTILAGFSVWL
jgi:outer membrane beta-barrel protein